MKKKEEAMKPGNRTRKGAEDAQKPGNRERKRHKEASAAGSHEQKRQKENSAAGSREQKRQRGVSGTEGRERQVWRGGNMLYPVPPVLVSCQRPGEKPNIITVAWAGTVCSSPAMLSISLRPERYSYDIIRETGEFVLNLPTRKLVQAVDYCGVKSGRDVDKFARMGLTVGKASEISAPFIAESPVNLECQVIQVLELGSHHMFLANVAAVDVDPEYLDEKGKLELNKAELITYSHGEYFALGKQLGTFGYSVKRRKY